MGNNRDNQFNDELKEVMKKISDLEQAASPLKEYMDSIRTVDTKIQTLIEKTDNIKRDLTKAARKIIGISPVTQEDLEHLTNNGITKENIYTEAAKEFLTKELKYVEEEYKGMDLIK